VTRQLMGIPWLAQIGFISFLAAAQLAPAVVAGLYWRGARGSAVLSGLLLGLGLWFYCGLLPAVLPSSAPLVTAGPWGVEWLRPLNLFGIAGENRLAYATFWSLSLNVSITVLLSLLMKPSAADARQAELFIENTPGEQLDEYSDFDLSLIRVSQLQGLLAPFVDNSQMRRMWREFEETNQQRLLPADRAPRFMVARVESVLASVIGATSAHKAMEQLENTQQLAFSDLAGMVADASRLHTFNRELLQTTVESLSQGVCVVDEELRIVAWNSRYEEMFDYPPRLLYVGCPIERIYEFNAQRGILSPGGNIEEEIEKRLQLMKNGSPHRLERTLPNGSVIAIHGTPMPHGGFVTTYVDITDYREMVAQLEEAREELEAKVASGTRSLSESNARLRQENRLRAQVEARLRDAHQSKSRFMSATSHDLLQPINAARLFTASLGTRLETIQDDDTREIVGQIDSSLRRAEQLIAELREIARLGGVFPVGHHLGLGSVLGHVAHGHVEGAAIGLHHVDLVHAAAFGGLDGQPAPAGPQIEHFRAQPSRQVADEQLGALVHLVPAEDARLAHVAPLDDALFGVGGGPLRPGGGEVLPPGEGEDAALVLALGVELAHHLAHHLLIALAPQLVGDGHHDGRPGAGQLVSLPEHGQGLKLVLAGQHNHAGPRTR